MIDYAVEAMWFLSICHEGYGFQNGFAMGAVLSVTYFVWH